MGIKGSPTAWYVSDITHIFFCCHSVMSLILTLQVLYIRESTGTVASETQAFGTVALSNR